MAGQWWVLLRNHKGLHFCIAVENLCGTLAVHRGPSFEGEGV